MSFKGKNAWGREYVWFALVGLGPPGWCSAECVTLCECHWIPLALKFAGCKLPRLQSITNFYKILGHRSCWSWTTWLVQCRMCDMWMSDVLQSLANYSDQTIGWHNPMCQVVSCALNCGGLVSCVMNSCQQLKNVNKVLRWWLWAVMGADCRSLGNKKEIICQQVWQM